LDNCLGINEKGLLYEERAFGYVFLLIRFFAFKTGEEFQVIPVTPFHTNPLTIILEVAWEQLQILQIEIDSMQARSYFNCARNFRIKYSFFFML